MFQYLGTSPLVLASASPRRVEFLETLGIPFEQQPTKFDESSVMPSEPETMVQAIADGKSQWAAERFADRWVLAADTIVCVADRIFGKPRDADDARKMLEQISGKTHSVWGGLSLRCGVGAEPLRAVSATRVSVRTLSRDFIERYVASGECFDKAGGYAIQGPFSPCVVEVQGSYTNVVGLDCALLLDLLEEASLLP